MAKIVAREKKNPMPANPFLRVFPEMGEFPTFGDAVRTSGLRRFPSPAVEVTMSHIIHCPCGHQLRGANDEELFAARAPQPIVSRPAREG